MAKKKKVIIFGSNSFSAGFIIKKLLSKNYKVLGISRSKLIRKEFRPFNTSHKNYIFYKLDINNDLNKILNLLKKNKPDFLLIHLLTSIPIVLFKIFKFKTHLILRISGFPKLNFFRNYLWKNSDKIGRAHV